MRIWRAGDQLSACLSASGQLTPGVAHTFQNIEADATELIDVRVEDLGQEANLGRSHRIVLGQKQLKLEYPAYNSLSLADTCNFCFGHAPS